MTIEQAGLILAWMAILVLAFAMSGLARQMVTFHAQRKTEAQPSGAISVGSRAPISHLVDKVSPVVLLFAEPGCATCESLWPLLEMLAGRFPAVTFQALYASDAGRSGDGIAVHSHAAEEFLAFGVHLTPYIVALDQTGIVKFAEPVASEVGLRMAVLSVSPRQEEDKVA